METSADIYNISFDKELGAVIMEWNGYATTGQFREGTELMLNVLIQNRCSKVLADISDMVIIGMDDQKWLEQDFLPRAIRFGFKKIAFIRPKFHFNKVAVESVSHKVDMEKLSIHFFDSAAEGKEWLQAD